MSGRYQGLTDSTQPEVFKISSVSKFSRCHSKEARGIKRREGDEVEERKCGAENCWFVAETQRDGLNSSVCRSDEASRLGWTFMS